MHLVASTSKLRSNTPPQTPRTASTTIAPADAKTCAVQSERGSSAARRTKRNLKSQIDDTPPHPFATSTPESADSSRSTTQTAARSKPKAAPKCETPDDTSSMN